MDMTRMRTDPITVRIILARLLTSTTCRKRLLGAEQEIFKA